MAVDIVLVLQSEHRRLLQLVERCGRQSRGFHDPATDLQNALAAHLMAAVAEIYPPASRLVAGQDWPVEALAAVAAAVDQEGIDPPVLGEAAKSLIEAEVQALLPALEGLEITARRRLGKVFRLRRDAAARTLNGSTRRHRTQTELYEVARRAGIEQRSRMTQAELQAAIDERGLNV